MRRGSVDRRRADGLPGGIAIQHVNELGREEFVGRFGGVYEGSPHFAEAAWLERPFGGLSDVYGAFVGAVRDAAPERKLRLIRAHPDLAGKAAVAGEITAESAGEQASAGLARLSPGEYEAFTRINREYRERFGFPMVVCVREHTKASILAGGEARLGNSRDEEIEVALGEINKIARLRLRDLIEPDEDDGEGSLAVAARSTKGGTGKIVLGRNNYGKSEIRLVKVVRDTTRHEVRDLTVDVAQSGDFEAAHIGGDNTGLMATDTMRNIVYALAKEKLTGSIEEFGVELVRHFLGAAPKAEKVRVRIVEHPWGRIEVNGKGHDHSFVRSAGERVATVTGDGDGVRVEAGIDDLLVLKTTQSGWEGFLRDEYTTLPETDDRILATVITANWSYDGGTTPNFDEVWSGVRRCILTTFTDHYSPSAQNTLYRMGEAVLTEYAEVERIHFSLPNKHHLPYDLGRFGMENKGEIFHASTEPYGVIEGFVERAR